MNGQDTFPISKTARISAALAGGWVADAASLGLHWLYDPKRIREVGGEAPEFLPPRASYFEGAFGFFAHGGKVLGDISHYGAATAVLLDSLLATGGELIIRDYQRRFRDCFGPGGSWCGYIDFPTRMTLDNLKAAEQEAISQGQQAEATVLSEEQRRILVQKVLPYTRRLSGDALDEPVRRAIALTYDDAEVQEAGVRMAHTLDRNLPPASGADDQQLPAISKLPPLVACYAGRTDLGRMVNAAVRVTNNNDQAVAWAQCIAVLLEAQFQGINLREALNLAQEKAPDPGALRDARGMSHLDGEAAGERFGRTCYLNEAVPVIFHILAHAGSFTEAIRANILCGGDSCGRAWVIGPAMAARHGVGGDHGIPLSWLARVTDGSRVLADIENLTLTGAGAD